MTAHRRPTCGARVKSRPGGTCEQPAGWGTNHVGTGRCKLHGGATPIKTGRCSEIYKQLPRIGERIAEFLEADDPLDLRRELATLRALLTDYIERYQEFTEALIAWHESFRDEEASPKPVKPDGGASCFGDGPGWQSCGDRRAPLEVGSSGLSDRSEAHSGALR